MNSEGEELLSILQQQLLPSAASGAELLPVIPGSMMGVDLLHFITFVVHGHMLCPVYRCGRPVTKIQYAWYSGRDCRIIHATTYYHIGGFTACVDYFRRGYQQNLWNSMAEQIAQVQLQPLAR